MPKRFLMARVFPAVAVGAFCIAFPISGKAHVVRPGSPQIAPPRLSTATATQIVERYLAQNPPVVRFALGRPVGARPPAAYGDLVRAGLLRIVEGTPGQAPGPSYDVTEKARREISAGFLRVKYIQMGADVPPAVFIEIPVGQFRYVTESAVVRHRNVETPPPDYQYNADALLALQPKVTFEYYFIGNGNVGKLRKLGPAKDWTIADYALPSLDLRQVGRMEARTFPLRVCHGVWTVRELPFGSPCP